MKFKNIYVVFILSCMVGLQARTPIHDLIEDKEEFTTDKVFSFLHEHQKDSSWFDTVTVKFEVFHDEKCNKKQWNEILGSFVQLSRSAQRSQPEEWVDTVAVPLKEIACHLGDESRIHGFISVGISEVAENDMVNIIFQAQRDSVYDAKVWQQIVDEAIDLTDKMNGILVDKESAKLEDLKTSYPLIGEIFEIVGAESGIHASLWEAFSDESKDHAVWIEYSDKNDEVQDSKE